MSIAFLLLVAAQSPATSPTELKSHVVSASVLKQGLALIVREVQVPAERATYKLDALPDALDGSFWFGSPDGVEVNDVTTKLRFKSGASVPANTIPEILIENLGKRIHFYVTQTIYTLKGAMDETKEITATLVNCPNSRNNGGPYTFKLDNGDLFVPDGTITRLDTKGLKTTVSRTMPEEEIDYQVESQHGGRVDFATLENDAAWADSYLVTLSSQSKADVVSKAQLAVGGLQLHNTDVRVVSGSPSLPEIVKFDLASGFGSLNAYLKNNQESYRRYRTVNRDPYTYIQSFFDQSGGFGGQSAFVSSGAMGSMGGGGFGGAGMRFADSPIDEPVSYNNQPKVQTDTQKVEDLYGFPLGSVDLEPGDRLSRVMFRVSSPYERLYRWKLIHDIQSPYQQPKEESSVDKILKVQNTSQLPWPGGTAEIVENDVPLGEVAMDFTPAGKSAELGLGQVTDIPVHQTFRELSRKNVVVRQMTLSEVTGEATLIVENTRKEDLPFEVSYQFSGAVDDPDGAQVEQLGTNVNTFNPETLLTWKFTLRPGEVKQFTVRFKTNV